MLRLILVCAAALSLQASPVTFNFTGVVTNVFATFPTGAAIGNFVDGSGSFDPADADQDSDPKGYFHAWSSGPHFLQVNIHTSGGIISFLGTTSGGVYLWDWDQAKYSPGDYMQFTAYGTSSSSAINTLAGSGQEFTLTLLDGSPPYDMLDGITPPSGLPDLTKATTASGFVRSTGFPNFYEIDFTLNQTPEPATGLPLLAAVVILSLFRRQIR